MSNEHASSIHLRGVRQNNLKGFDLDIPLGKWTVVTGLSGAGKSSLVFDTLHAEGQRRYVETFSAYTRQFLELLDKPDVDEIENIRPSIAIQQSNTVKTSRSTVGTMTELCDYFKVWFSHAARLHDPETGEIIEDDNPHTIWEKVLRDYPDREAMLAFTVKRPAKLKESEILHSLAGQGFSRIVIDGKLLRMDDIKEAPAFETLLVIADRMRVAPEQQNRFIEAARQCLHFGEGLMQLLLPPKQKRPAKSGKVAPWETVTHAAGLSSPATGQRFRPATPGLFSFNSPLGACPQCRGFGRVIEIDYGLVIPDESLSIEEGAIRAFQGQVYSESLRDLMKAAKRCKIPLNKPWKAMSDKHKHFVLEGEAGYSEDGKEWPQAWYGVRRFFEWLEGNTYKMHVRIFLSKYRAYTQCPACKGNRLVPEALHWKWNGHTLPDLYRMPVGELLEILKKKTGKLRTTSNGTPEKHQAAIALNSILTRLHYLKQVGLEYLTLDRTSRTLSGGETMRVSLTSCLGTSLVDTLFVLDEPSIGLHSRDINRLISILRRLTDAGNTVVVVEHDEAIMRAADHLIEVGPEPGMRGGHITFSGPVHEALRSRNCLTGQYLSGEKQIAPPASRRKVLPFKTGSEKRKGMPETPCLRIRGASRHNIRNLDFDLPLRRFVCLSGVSGSGKSTLLDNVLFQGFQRQKNLHSESPASIREWLCDTELNQVVLVDQSPVSRTPRSNPVLYCEAWDDVRNLFATCETAQAAGFTASHFSFNSGQGRCEHCQGLGYERVEMQFLSDIFVSCPHCEGKRFKPEILAVTLMDKSVADILNMDVSTAMAFFEKQPRIRRKLSFLSEVGLGYLSLGQPLNTLSGGESQRLKLVKYLSQLNPDTAGSLLLLDEPSTGLHREDIARLIQVLQRLIDLGHSLVVIEHNTDILKSADWIIEMGPEAGDQGGRIIFSGPPEALAATPGPSAPFMQAALAESGNNIVPWEELARVAEETLDYNGDSHREKTRALQIIGAREHNLKNLSLEIPHGQLSVITGVSGSGKSSLAFDIVFAEGQRRFMESMSAYARQFVEQMPRPDIDGLHGIAPTVAIEQRITRGSRKSTVATITEVAQYLRLLYSRVGIQHSPVTGDPLVALSEPQLRKLLTQTLNTPEAKKAKKLYLCAPVIRGRKGHHQPLANWAVDHGYGLLRVDGQWVPSADFRKLDRYREHDIDLVISDLKASRSKERDTLRTNGTWPNPAEALSEALKRGQGNAYLMDARGKTLAWFSTSRTDPATGEAYPELDPKNFSWNSPKGWCPKCRGYGRLYSWMTGDENFQEVEDTVEDGQVCPDCQGERLNPVSRAVFIQLVPGGRSKRATKLNLPGLLHLPAGELIQTLKDLKLDSRGRQIARDILPQIAERLQFMDEVGLSYLTMDRATITLSGGEAQRIRLAAQLGSHLSGVLYVLDEPSIGLHARDNAKLIESLHTLRGKGNTLLVVEHDDDTMRAADHIIDLGPGAGIHGGKLLAQGHYSTLLENPESLTGRYLKEGIPHPLRGAYRPLPKPWNPRSQSRDWLVLRKPTLRNLKGNDLHLPLGRLVILCGISGSGKSTLARDLLRPAVEQAIKSKKASLPGQSLPSLCDSDAPVFQQLINGNQFRHVIEVDQEPIGKTPRSTPATYIGAFDIIRTFFASLPEARIHGYKGGYFSFNTKGGRCETCQGAGRIKLEMNFLPDSYLPCEDCGGDRYGPELREIRWKGKNIAEVLSMSFEEAAAFFDFHTKLHAMLNLMVETGLGYLTLGQSSPTLSGGEAQRLKLVSELAKGLPSFKEKSHNIQVKNLYLLEEPTIGLHLSDCQRLIELLQRLVDQGHTVIVIEHNLDIIAEADYLIEIGPEGGEGGGKILYQGSLRGILKVKKSPTAPFLRDKLECRLSGIL